MKSVLVTSAKTRLSADNLNYYNTLKIEGKYKQITRGRIDGKRVYFIETIDYTGAMIETVTHSSFSKAIKTL